MRPDSSKPLTLSRTVVTGLLPGAALSRNRAVTQRPQPGTIPKPERSPAMWWRPSAAGEAEVWLWLPEPPRAAARQNDGGRDHAGSITETSWPASTSAVSAAIIAMSGARNMAAIECAA